ncbi:sensor histidine kinase [Roseicella sp. DB1501]|uniref:sensor histidine kinase n=1 Tax=Roseicella sp. DB1501 TaxID=2730925 RepID=UPI00149203AC|nr:HWE histidine kinase domain-containing protein [Roseicella sp. DB1501]NOG74169.1 PAS domain S-box protein [Roseicella sp. DB1501]
MPSENKQPPLALKDQPERIRELTRERDALVTENEALRNALAAANLALREGEEHLRLIFESATEYAIFTLGLDGLVTAWNPGAKRFLGYETEDILGHSADVIFMPEDRAADVPEIEMSRAANEGCAADERWHVRQDGSRFWAAGMMMPLLDSGGELRGFLKILRDRTEQRREEERRRLLLRELDHRVKNTLATVQSVAAQSLRYAPNPAAFRKAFDARLLALARAHDMLARGGWEGAPLREVIERTLEPYATDGEAGRVSADGPPVLLAPNAAVTLNLALHELATNAAKYGSLSARGGRVDVTWTLGRRFNDDVPAVEIHWRERGGPPVRPPERRGFGSRLLERALPYESGGEVRLDFAPQGVECRIRLPLPPPPEKEGAP